MRIHKCGGQARLLSWLNRVDIKMYMIHHQNRQIASKREQENEFENQQEKLRQIHAYNERHWENIETFCSAIQSSKYQ